MKKTLLSVVTLCVVSASQAAVGDDLTSKYLKNADFSQGSPIGAYVCTYDYDMANVNKEDFPVVLYGQQAVEGWEAPNLSDNEFVDGRTDGLNARAGAVFAIPGDDESPERLGGLSYYAPMYSSTEANTGQVLGMVGVWGTKIQYTQNVTLPAGAYTIKFMTCNTYGEGAVSANHFGFIAEDGTAYTCENLTWTASTALDMVWEEQEVTFILDKETSGVVSVGYTGPGGSDSMPHVFVESVKILQADANAIIKAQVDALKESDLLPLLEQGDELGVDTKAGWAVYNNPDATMDDVKNAIATQKQNNENGMTDFTDIFISNAHFAAGTPLDAGVCTYDYDMVPQKNDTKYYGMQPIEKWTANKPSDNTLLSEVNENGDKTKDRSDDLNGRASGLFAVGSPEEVWLGSKGDVVPATKANGATEGNLFGFISVWSMSSYYYQNATLPAGSYTITIPTYNERGTGKVAKNLCGFVAEDGTEYLAETLEFPVGKWSNETIKFELEEETSGQFRIGYQASNAGSGSMPHLFVDEFTLMYNGVLDNPTMYALKGVVNTAETFLSNSVPCEETIWSKLEEATEKGQDLIDNGSDNEEANTAAVAAINAALAEVEVSAAAYEKFLNFIEGNLADAINKYSDGDMSDFADQLSELSDNYRDAYESGSYTTEQINEAIAGLKPTIAAAVQTALVAASTDDAEHSIDISVLFENINFENKSTAGWTCDRTAGKFESQQDGVLEVWHNSAVNEFTAYTTLANLPAGAYEISAPGWFRDAGDMAVGYDHYMNNSVTGAAYIFANGNKTELINQADERLVGSEEDEIHNGKIGDGEVYLPNGQANAQIVFYYSDIDVTNTVTTALLEEGDLTIGFKGEGLTDGTWTVWGAMTVVYKGNTTALVMDALNDELASLIADGGALYDNDEISGVEEACIKLDAAINNGDNALSSDSRDAKTAAIRELRAALEYAKQIPAAIAALTEKYTLYHDYLMEGVEGESAEYEALIEKVDACLSDVEFESLEQIQALTESISTGFAAYVQNPVLATSTVANPGNITGVVVNADFEGVINGAGAEFWTVTKDGGSEGVEYGIYEFYNNNSFDIHQTIKGLAEGYYRVRVQGFYRAGDNQNLADSIAVYGTGYGRQAELYANGSAVALKNVFERQDEQGNLSTEMLANVGNEVKVNYNGVEEFYVPNNREALQHYFDADIYWNVLDCHVDASGELTLGIRKAERVMGGDWCPYDNFELYYLGTTAPDAIEGVAAGEGQKNSGIYDLMGRRVSKLVRGLYIVDGKKVIR